MYDSIHPPTIEHDLLVTACIVLYKNDPKMVEKAMQSFLSVGIKSKLFLVDNSPDAHILENINNCQRVEYQHNSSNFGFGVAHNMGINKALNSNAKYHLVYNPDIYFQDGVVEQLIEYMEDHPDIGIITPKTLYPDGTTQYLCRILPTPFDLFMRRFIPRFLKPIVQWRLNMYEMRHKSYDEIMEIPNISGSFMLFRTDLFKKVGFFDERIFMYTEDIDMTRRAAKHYKTVYYPYVQVVHEHAQGSYKTMRLALVHIRSAIYYFNKWGWFFDLDRVKINRRLKS